MSLYIRSRAERYRCRVLCPRRFRICAEPPPERRTGASALSGGAWRNTSALALKFLQECGFPLPDSDLANCPPWQERVNIMARLAAHLATYLWAMLVAILIITPCAHADTQAYLSCLRSYNIDNLGRDQDWWVGLARVVRADYQRGVTKDRIARELMRAGLTYPDAAHMLSCAVDYPP